MNKYIKKLAKKIALEDTNMVLVDANELVELRLAKSKLNDVKPLSQAQLTMLQLGSYLPNFEMLNTQSEQFRNEIGLFCSNLRKTEAWKYLINHLKQDQVNLSLFSDDVSAPNRNEQFTRGSINGIYVVEDQVERLGMSYDENNKGIS